jgi:hypothetical protein
LRERTHFVDCRTRHLGKRPANGHGRAVSGNDVIFFFLNPTELPMPAVQPSDIASGLVAASLPVVSAVRAMRETRGYSIEELSLTCGLAAFELADIESGRDTDPAKLRRIASALGLPEDTFVAAG